MKTRGTGAARTSALALGIAAALLAAGCGRAGPAGGGSITPAAAAPLTTSFSAAGASWAVIPLATSSGRFWELAVKRAGAARWSLATPPGVASNGGLVVGYRGGRSLVAGFRPSEDMVFSPLAVTADAGRTWSPGLLRTGLADVPDALAGTRGGRLLALLTGGQAKLSGPAGRRWAAIASAGRLAATAPGRACGLTRLTAVTFSPLGTPMLGGTCTRGTAAGIFAYRAGRWRAAGPRLTAPLAGTAVRVLRLTTAGTGDVALLAAGKAPAVRLLAAWSGDAGRHWTLSAPLRAGSPGLACAAFGPGGSVAVLRAGGAAAVLSGRRASWRRLPAVPASTAALVLDPGGRIDALAARGTQVTVWRLTPGRGAWARSQVLKAPLQQ